MLVRVISERASAGAKRRAEQRTRREGDCVQVVFLEFGFFSGKVFSKNVQKMVRHHWRASSASWGFLDHRLGLTAMKMRCALPGVPGDERL